MELAWALEHLEEARPGHARRFLDVYEAKLRQIARFPESGMLIATLQKGMTSAPSRCAHSATPSSWPRWMEGPPSWPSCMSAARPATGVNA